MQIAVEGQRKDVADGQAEEYDESMVEGQGQAKVQEGDSKVEDGVVRFLVEGEWRQVSHEYWAWKPLVQHKMYRRCKYHWCNFPFDCSDQWHGKREWDHGYVDWIPKVRCGFMLDMSRTRTEFYAAHMRSRTYWKLSQVNFTTNIAVSLG